MLKPQAAVIHKIDRNAANPGAIDGLAATLNQSPPKPTPPTATGLIAILLAEVGQTANYYGVALFDTFAHATAAKGTFSIFWRTTANLGNAAVHDPVVAAAAAVSLVAGAPTPDARMVWVPAPLPVPTQLLVLLIDVQLVLVAAIRALLDAIRRTKKPRASGSITTHGAE